jgi:HEAT repeat protein
MARDSESPALRRLGVVVRAILGGADVDLIGEHTAILKDGNPATQLAAARALGAQGAAAAPCTGALNAALIESKDWQLRFVAAKSLGALGALGALHSAGGDSSAGSFVDVSSWAPRPEAPAHGTPVLEAGSVAVEQEDRAFAHIGVPTALSRALEDGNEFVREAAAEALGLQVSAVGSGASASLAATLRGDSSWLVRSVAARALGRLASFLHAGGKAAREETEEALAAALGDEHWQVRWRAAEALRMAGVTAARLHSGALAAVLLHDTAWRVRCEAASALGAAGTAQSVSGLAAALHGDTPAQQISRKLQSVLNKILAFPLEMLYSCRKTRRYPYFTNM